MCTLFFSNQVYEGRRVLRELFYPDLRIFFTVDVQTRVHNLRPLECLLAAGQKG